jgi:hypothetical protein
MNVKVQARIEDAKKSALLDAKQKKIKQTLAPMKSIAQEPRAGKKSKSEIISEVRSELGD